MTAEEGSIDEQILRKMDDFYQAHGHWPKGLVVGWEVAKWLDNELRDPVHFESVPDVSSETYRGLQVFRDLNPFTLMVI